MKARSAGVTELTRLELKPLGINSVRLREDLTDGVIAHRDDVLAAPVVRAAAQAADESQDSGTYGSPFIVDCCSIA